MKLDTIQRASFTQPNASTTITTTTAARDNWQQPPPGERNFCVTSEARDGRSPPRRAQKCSEYTSILVSTQNQNWSTATKRRVYFLAVLNISL